MTARPTPRPTPRMSPREVAEALVRGVAEHRWAELPGLYAEQTRVEHPLDPLGAPPLLSRQQVAEHFAPGPEDPPLPRMESAVTVHETADPEVVVAECEYRGTLPESGESFRHRAVFVMRVRDGQIVASRDYVDHVGLARITGQAGALAAAIAGRDLAALGDGPDLGAPARGGHRSEDRLGRAGLLWERAVFGGDAGAVELAERELDAAEADLALARGRVLHARFLGTGTDDPRERELFERAAAIFRALGDVRGEAEALFWTAAYHQVVQADEVAARPLLRRSYELAATAGDALTRSYAARHLGFAELAAGRPEPARDLLEESVRLRRELGFLPGVAAGILALAELAAARDERARALGLLDEAAGVAAECGAAGVLAWIGRARSRLRPAQDRVPGAQDRVPGAQ